MVLPGVAAEKVVMSTVIDDAVTVVTETAGAVDTVDGTGDLGAFSVKDGISGGSGGSTEFTPTATRSRNNARTDGDIQPENKLNNDLVIIT